MLFALQGASEFDQAHNLKVGGSMKAYPSGSGGDERAIGARLRAATDKMLIAPEATA
jgi:hypothetical protein